MTQPRKASKDKALSTVISHLLVSVGLVGYNTLITEYTKYLVFSPDKHSAVLIPVRLQDMSSDIEFDCKINVSSWSTSPKQFSLQALCQLVCQLVCQLGWVK